MLITTSQRRRCLDTPAYRISMNNETLLRVQEAKILGVLFDENLTFESHVNKLCKKVSMKLGIFRKLRNILTLPVKKMLYNAIVLPHTDYADVIWGTASTTIINKVFVLQKRALRLLTNSHYLEHTDALYKQLGWMKLADRINFHKCVLVYKALNNKLPSYMRSLMQYVREAHSRETRLSAKGCLSVPNVKLSLFKRSFQYSAIHKWNQLPEHIRASPSLNIFKSQFLKYHFEVPT